MNLGIELKQKQTLTLTLEMRQSINILQYSSLELVEFLQEQTIENPFLEIKETVNEPFVTRNGEFPSFRTYNKDSEYDPITHYSNTITTLEGHLIEQINILPNISEKQKKILQFLIGHLNRHGFLEIEPFIAAQILSVSLNDIENSILLLQSLDPIGVGAKNFKDCLLIQMKAQSYDDHLAYILIEKHMEDIAANNLRKIAKLQNVTIEDVQEAVDYIKTLNPRPCSEFNHDMTQYIAPDIIVEKIKNEYFIIVNDSVIPKLSINQFYKNNDMDLEDDYIKKKFQEASILMNGIEQRKHTLYKVAEVLINTQKDFFTYGINKLKPMTLKDIADQLDVHESTVSRATSNKYIQTPHGIYLIKNLFTTGLSINNSGEAESSVAIKGKIKALIREEDNKKPLSDQMIANLLSQQGIKISRRTVAKYREEEGIPSSAKRKKY